MWHSRVSSSTDFAADQLVPSSSLIPAYFVPVVRIPVFTPEKAGCTGESGRLVIFYGGAALVEEHRVQNRHGRRPDHDEDPRRHQDRHVLCGPTRPQVGIALNIERGGQVEPGHGG